MLKKIYFDENQIFFAACGARWSFSANPDRTSTGGGRSGVSRPEKASQLPGGGTQTIIRSISGLKFCPNVGQFSQNL